MDDLRTASNLDSELISIRSVLGTGEKMKEWIFGYEFFF